METKGKKRQTDCKLFYKEAIKEYVKDGRKRKKPMGTVGFEKWTYADGKVDYDIEGSTYKYIHLKALAKLLNKEVERVEQERSESKKQGRLNLK